MNYRVIYLAAGQRETVHLEAPDAASAVAAVADEKDRGPATFELLSVVVASGPPLAPERRRTEAD